MDVTLQRNDVIEIAERAAGFSDPILRLRTDGNKLIASATGRIAAFEPISEVVSDTFMPAAVAIPGIAVVEPGELAEQARTQTTHQIRIVSVPAPPGFEIISIAPSGGGVATPAPPPPSVASPAPVPVATRAPIEIGPYVAAYLSAGTFKFRRPATLPLLAVVTLGIYLFVWYFRVNRELRDLGALTGAAGRDLNVNPGRSTLALSLGALAIVPPFLSLQRTFARVRLAEEVTDTSYPHLRPARAWPLVLLVIPFWAAHIQSHMNKIWAEQLGGVESLPAPTRAPMPQPVEREPVARKPVVHEPVVQEPVVRDPIPAPVVEPVIEQPTPEPRVELLPPPAPSTDYSWLDSPTPAVASEAADEPDPAIAIVRARYARGEITREEYFALLTDLA